MPYNVHVTPQKIEVKDVPCQGHGGIWPNAVLEYETYGARQDSHKADKPVIVILPFFLGSAHAAGFHDPKGTKGNGYWEPLIGPGNAFNTDTHYIVSFGPLISSSFGPHLPNPATKAPYGSAFPNFSFANYATIQKKALAAMGIQHVDVVAGASMGSLQAWHMLVDDLKFVDKMVLLVPGGASLPTKTRQLARKWVSMLESDPHWNNGNYYAIDPKTNKPTAFKPDTLGQVLGEFWYRCQFPLSTHLVWDQLDEYYEEIFKALGGADAGSSGLISDAVAKKLADTGKAGQAFAGQVGKLTKVTDYNTLLWQLRTIDSFEALDMVDEVVKVEREKPLRIMMIYAPSDDIFTEYSINETGLIGYKFQAQVSTIQFPPGSPHGAGLTPPGLGALPNLDGQLKSWLNAGGGAKL